MSQKKKKSVKKRFLRERSAKNRLIGKIKVQDATSHVVFLKAYLKLSKTPSF